MDAFGMVAAAVILTREPWSVGVRRTDRTPLCLVWGHYMDAPASIAAGAWLGGWEGVEWPEVDAWPSVDSTAKRLDAYTLGVMARKVWDEARAKEHEPHAFNATPIHGKLRCRCGAWAHGYMEYGKPVVTRAGKKWWKKLDAKLAEYRDENVLVTLHGPRYKRGFPPYVPDSTPAVDDVIAGRRRP